MRDCGVNMVQYDIVLYTVCELYTKIIDEILDDMDDYVLSKYVHVSQYIGENTPPDIWS